MKKITILLLGLSGLCLAGRAAVAKIETAEGPRYRLANEYLEVMVDPACGGRIESMKQPGHPELLSADTPERTPAGSGIGQERLVMVGHGNVRQTEAAPWRVTATADDGVYSSITLENDDSPLHLVKTYRLPHDAASVRVDYAVDNPTDTNFFGKLWFVTVPFPAGTEQMRYYYPRGLRAGWADFFTGRPALEPVRWPEQTGDILTNETAAGWAAGINDAGIGILLEPDYADLLSFYNFLPNDGPGQSTLEFLTPELKIRPLSVGKAMMNTRPEMKDPLFDFIYRTGYTVMPLAGLETVDAADNRIAAMFRRDGETVTIRLLSDRDYPALTLRCGGAERNIALKALEPAEFAMPLTGEDQVTVTLNDPSGVMVAELTKNFDPAVRQQPKTAKNSLFVNIVEHAGFFKEFSPEIVRWAADTERPLKILIVTTAWSHHDIGELEVRGNLEMDLVEVGYPDWFVFNQHDNRGWVAPESLSYLRRVLQKEHDVILIGASCRWHAFPEDTREQILQQVADGTGLVYVDSLDGVDQLGLPLEYDEAATLELNRAVPFDHLKAIRRDPSPEAMPLKVYSSGKGKVISVGYCLNQNSREWQIQSFGLIPAPKFGTECTFNYYDYHFSQLLRALRLAAGDRPEDRLVAVAPEKDTLTVTVAADEAAPAELVWETRDKFGRKVAEQQQEVTLQAPESQFQLALLPEKMQLDGDYFYDVFLKRNGHTADWFSAVENRPAVCAMEEFALDKLAWQPGETVTGRLRLRGDWNNTEVSLVAKDRYGRTLGTQKIIPAGPEEKVAIEFETAPATVLSEVTAELRRDGVMLDRAAASVTLPLPERPRLTFTIWGCNANYYSDEYYRILADAGFDEVIGDNVLLTNPEQQKKSAESALRSRLNYIPLGIHWLTLHNLEELKWVERNPCLRNPEYLTEMYHNVGEGVKLLADYRPNSYFIADENSLGIGDWSHDLCQSPWCLAAFREMLQKRYGTVEVLNAAWNTRLADWEAVRPFTHAEATAQDNFLPWIAHRIFMFGAFSGAVKNQYEAMKAVDPAGNLAISGMTITNMYVGYNWHDSMKYLSRVIAYDQDNSGTDDLLRSFERPGTQLGVWTGYNRPIPYVREMTYREILSGLSGNGNFASGFLMRHGDMKLTDYGKETAAMIAEIKSSGLDVITEPANRRSSPFAILFSIPSLVISGAGDTKETESRFRLYPRNFGSWTALIGNIGFQGPRVVDPLDLDKLDPAETPFLILPLAQGLSDADLQNILTFVERGGRLIADSLPGVCDDDGTKREDNPLAELFGVEAAFRPAAAGENLKIDGSQSVLELADPAIVLKGGVPADAAEKRILIGRNGHLLLNVLAGNYGAIRADGRNADPAVEFFRQAFELAGVPDDWSLRLPPATEAMRYRLDGNEYLGLTRMEGDKRERNDAVLQFDRQYYIYDLLAHQELAVADRLDLTLEPLGVKVLALLPEPTQPFSLELERDGRCVKAVITSPGPAGIYRLEVFEPNGTPYWPSTGNHGIRERGEIVVNPGLTPSPGEWTFRVINLLDGTTMEEVIDF